MLGPGIQAQKCWIHTGFWLPDLETHASGRRQFPVASVRVFPPFLLSPPWAFLSSEAGPALAAPACALPHLGED